jgi:hypothetical protein
MHRMFLKTGGVAKVGSWCTLLAVVGLLVPAGVASAIGQAERNLPQRPSRAEMPLPKGMTFEVAADSVADPVGDTLGSSANQPDITSLNASIAGGSLVITVDFAGNIAAPGADSPVALDGFIDLDTDQDGNTGDLPWTDARTNSNTTGMGNEFYVDLFTYDPSTGTVQVVDDPTEQVAGEATATFSGNTARFAIPLSVLADDGFVNVAAVFGTLDDPVTDIAPNQGSVASSVSNDVIALQGGRFTVQVAWVDSRNGTTGVGREVVKSDDSAVLYFFDPDNWEMLVKVLDACSFANHYWVFFAATTDVEFTLTVTDTQTGTVKTYLNPDLTPADAVTDTSAFATCP